MDVEHGPRDGQFVMKEERFLWLAGHETPGDKEPETREESHMTRLCCRS